MSLKLNLFVRIGSEWIFFDPVIQIKRVENVLIILSSRFVANSSYPIEQMPRNHLFLYLLSVLQHQGHNEFRIKDGPLVVIDVDRANFVSFKSYDFGLEHLCKLDKTTFNIMQDMAKVPSMTHSVGGIVTEILRDFAPEIIFTSNSTMALQLRIEHLVEKFEECIDTYGETIVTGKQIGRASCRERV